MGIGSSGSVWRRINGRITLSVLGRCFSMALDLDSPGFAPSTLIQTPYGHLPIEQIRVGMQVLAQPEVAVSGLTGR